MSRRLASASALATISAAASWALWSTRAVSIPNAAVSVGLVEHRIGRPVLGGSQLLEQLVLAVGDATQADGDGFQIGTYFVGIEASPHRAERVAGHVVRGQMG